MPQIAAVAAMALGGGLQIKSAIDSGKAQQNASTDFLQRQTALLSQQQKDNQNAQAQIALQQAAQQKYRDQSGAVTDAAITSNSRPAQDAQQAAIEAQRNAASQSISDLHPANIDLGNSPTSPSIVGDAIAKSIAAAKAKGVQQAMAENAIKAFGDLNTNNQITMRDNSDKIHTISGENNISGTLADQQKDYMNTLAGITTNQISNAGTDVNTRLAYNMNKNKQISSIGDLLFKAGSFGAGGGFSGGATAAPTTGAGSGAFGSNGDAPMMGR